MTATCRLRRYIPTARYSAVMENVSWLKNFEAQRALDRPELLADPVTVALGELSAQSHFAADQVLAAPIDGELADTAVFCQHYGVPLDASANCVITLGKRAGQERFAAVVVLATMRADINGFVRRKVDVRKISFAPMDVATGLTGMEYGGITPIGLPTDWPILIDAAVVDAGPVVIGAGKRAAKIIVDGRALAQLPGAQVYEGLAG